jgi:phenylacetate-CoA ligase
VVVQGDEVVEVRDPVTARAFRFDELQWDIISALGRTDVAAIAAELGEPEAQIAQFVTKLGDLGLLASRPVPAAELGQRQARMLVPEAQARRDRGVAMSVRWAAEHIPYFRERIAATVAEVHGLADLVKLPTMTKRDFRAHFPGGLLRDGLDLDHLVESGEAQIATTSGSTGGRLAFIRDNNRDIVSTRLPGVREVPGGWMAARVARFTTPLCSGAVCHVGNVPFEERIINDTLHLNSSERVLQLRRAAVEQLLSDVEQFRANVFQVDPVYAVALVRAIERFGLAMPRFHAVLSFFEYCSVLHREVLERTFAPVTDFLSAADLGGGVAAFACEHGRFHVNEHENVFEFLRHGKPVAYGEVGEITVTSLNHRFTRWIRYRLGDLATPVEHCGCAYDDWAAFEFEGRVQDCIGDTRGRPITTRAVDQQFVGESWLDFYQLVQHAPTRYELAVIRRPGTEADPARVIDRLKAVLGHDAEIVVENVRELPIEPSFKFPLTKRSSTAPPLVEEW